MAPQARGRAIEAVVARCFQAAKFTVQTDAGAAAPCQTDLIARYGDRTFLVECKWRARRSDPDDLANLRDRLARPAGHPVGVLVTKAGVTKGFVDELERFRTPAIVVIDEHELSGIVYRPDALRALLERKVMLLADNGTVDLSTGPVTPAPLPRPREQRLFVLDEQDREIDWQIGDDNFGSYVPALRLNDSDWG
jgi:hypothetical protein